MSSLYHVEQNSIHRALGFLRKTSRNLCIGVAVALTAVGTSASAATILFDFEDGTDQGLSQPFVSPDDTVFPVSLIGGSQRVGVLNTGGYQEAAFGFGGLADPFVVAVNAAIADPSNYTFSYDYYIDTSPAATSTPGTFLQIGEYFNTGDGTYVQNGTVFELGFTELNSGNVFSGTISGTFAARGYLAAPVDFYRIGFILNGDGNQVVYLDNVSVAPVAVPEPGSMLLCASVISAAGFVTYRKRKASKA